MSAFVIHPRYTGRDKGCLSVGCDCKPNVPVAERRHPPHAKGCAIFSGRPLEFPSEPAAWDHIFTVVQPNDPRAERNYRVVPLTEYANGCEVLR